MVYANSLEHVVDISVCQEEDMRILSGFLYFIIVAVNYFDLRMFLRPVDALCDGFRRHATRRRLT